MDRHELELWLAGPESLKVGQKKSDAESIGHASGRRIARILATDRRELTEDDYGHMRKTVGYIRRYLAQQPENVVTSRWRYSLMNWGHDPLK
ncbi:MAG: DUF3140 domain-containing protein [Sphingosinicella sp.]|nr:DUF3140 domain-containing protein [Sphingosinicella sp.]